MTHCTFFFPFDFNSGVHYFFFAISSATTHTFERRGDSHTWMMHLSALLPLFIVPFAASISSHHPQHVFSNPPKSTAKTFRIPTVRESAIQARRILHLSSIGTLSSVFPSSSNNLERRPADVGGSPIGLMDYYASCSPTPSEPIILAVSIATAMKNAAAGSNITLSMRYHPPSDHPPSDDIYTYSPANLPRFSLIGYLEPIPSCEVSKHKIKECFLEEHPDAEIWTPGNDIHESYWARLVVEEVWRFRW